MGMICMASSRAVDAWMGMGVDEGSMCVPYVCTKLAMICMVPNGTQPRTEWDRARVYVKIHGRPLL